MKILVAEEFKSLLDTFLSEEDLFLLPNLKLQTALQHDPHLRKAMADGDFFATLKYVAKKEVVDARIADTKLLIKALQDFSPSLIVYNSTVCVEGARLAAHMGIPSVYITMQMLVVSSYEGPVGLLSPQTINKLPACVVRLLWSAFFLLFATTPWIGRVHGAIDAAFGRKPTTGFFQKLESTMKAFLGKSPNCLLLIARSRLSSPPPPDWSDEDKKALVGPLVICAEDQVRAWPPPQSLLDFISSSDQPPVYFGWGSMIACSPLHMMELAVRTLMRLKRRGIILSGWAGLCLELLDSSKAEDAQALLDYARRAVFILDNSAPHEWLFRQCSAVVHHGGAGTTASALRSGRPSIITPCAFDQPEIADKVTKLGVGIGLSQFHKVTSDDLVNALWSALHDQTLVEQAAALGSQMRAEDGATEAASRIMTFIGHKRESTSKNIGEDTIPFGRVETPELVSRSRPLLAASAV